MLRGTNPAALVGDTSFVCAVRSAFSQLASAPIASVLVVGIKSEGRVYPVVLSQARGTCGSSARRLAPTSLSSSEVVERHRRAQASVTLSVEVSVDVSASTVTLTPGTTAAQAVRSVLDTTFTQDPSLVDLLFSNVTLAACSAQGLPIYLCPNPPSFVLALAPAPSSGSPSAQGQAGTDVLIPAVIGAAVGSALLVWAALVAVRKCGCYCCGCGERGAASTSSSKIAPLPLPLPQPADVGVVTIVREVVQHIPLPPPPASAPPVDEDASLDPQPTTGKQAWS
jgi:hypothetical protein